MKRALAFSAIPLLALSLAACNSDASTTSTTTTPPTSSAPAEDPEEPTADYTGVTLTIWTDETRLKPMQEATKSFQDATGAKIKLVQKNYDDIRTDFVTQVPTGKGPDITIGAHDWLGELVSNGVISPLEIGDIAADFNPVAIQALTQDGTVYGLPYAIENVALIRNTDLVAEAPATWDDALAASEAADAKYPILIQTGEEGDPYTYYPLQTSFGAPVFEQNADGSYTSNLSMGGDEGHNFANWLAEQGKAGVLDTSITYDIATDAFSKGESPYIIGGPWMLDTFKNLNLSIDPIPTAGGETASPFVGVSCFYLSSQSENAIVANDFLTNYVASKDVQLDLFAQQARTPALIAAAQEVASDPIVAGFAAVASDSVPMPSIPEMNSVWQFWGVTEADIISGKQDPVKAWDKMIEDINAAIAG